MELMIRGTSALVSLPSQWVRQVAPLPEAKGGNDSHYSGSGLRARARSTPVPSDASSVNALEGDPEGSVLPRPPF